MCWNGTWQDVRSGALETARYTTQKVQRVARDTGELSMLSCFWPELSLVLYSRTHTHARSLRVQKTN